ncbi:MAG: class II aldolase/adducin family protein [Planctomycetaceae bacterium]|nr:class II aldolase/adducin family protein [Planctomycetaceae bacterium]
MYNRLIAERESVAYFMRRLYNKDLTTCSGGNISLRLPGELVLITPSALDKGELQPDQVALMQMDGVNLTRHLPLTIEWEMHLEVLRARPDITAVVHAHPPYATAFACMDTPLDIGISSEIYLLLDGIAEAPYAPPGTTELARNVGQSMVGKSVCLMRNHGVITVGKTLLKAFDLMEVIENTAKMNFVAQAFGGARPLSVEEKRVTNAAYNRTVDF